MSSIFDLSKEDSYDKLTQLRIGYINNRDLNKHVRNIANTKSILFNEDNAKKPFD